MPIMPRSAREGGGHDPGHPMTGPSAPGAPLRSLPRPVGLSLRVSGVPTERTSNRSSCCQPARRSQLTGLSYVTLLTPLGQGQGKDGRALSPCPVPGGERGRLPLLSRVPR